MSALEYYYQSQKTNYEAVRGTLVGVLLMMVKLEMLKPHDKFDKTLPEYINDYAKTKKITRIDSKAKRFV